MHTGITDPAERVDVPRPRRPWAAYVTAALSAAEAVLFVYVQFVVVHVLNSRVAVTGEADQAAAVFLFAQLLPLAVAIACAWSTYRTLTRSRAVLAYRAERRAYRAATSPT